MHRKMLLKIMEFYGGNNIYWKCLQEKRRKHKKETPRKTTSFNVKHYCTYAVFKGFFPLRLSSIQLLPFTILNQFFAQIFTYSFSHFILLNGNFRTASIAKTNNILRSMMIKENTIDSAMMNKCSYKSLFHFYDTLNDLRCLPKHTQNSKVYWSDSV